MTGNQGSLMVFDGALVELLKKGNMHFFHLHGMIDPVNPSHLILSNIFYTFICTIPCLYRRHPINL